jgi:hypothetical protein
VVYGLGVYSGTTLIAGAHTPIQPGRDNRDAAYIAAMSPDVALRLIDRLAAVELERDAATESHGDAVRLVNYFKAERDAMAADAQRFAWWFSPHAKNVDIAGYVAGCNENWALDKWRKFIDAAISKEQSNG